MLRKILIGSAAVLAIVGLTASSCESDAGVVSENLSTEADQQLGI